MAVRFVVCSGQRVRLETWRFNRVCTILNEMFRVLRNWMVCSIEFWWWRSVSLEHHRLLLLNAYTITITQQPSVAIRNQFKIFGAWECLCVWQCVDVTRIPFAAAIHFVRSRETLHTFIPLLFEFYVLELLADVRIEHTQRIEAVCAVCACILCAC